MTRDELESSINDMVSNYYDEWHPLMDAIMHMIDEYADECMSPCCQDLE